MAVTLYFVQQKQIKKEKEESVGDAVQFNTGTDGLCGDGQRRREVLGKGGMGEAVCGRGCEFKKKERRYFKQLQPKFNDG